MIPPCLGQAELRPLWLESQLNEFFVTKKVGPYNHIVAYTRIPFHRVLFPSISNEFSIILATEVVIFWLKETFNTLTVFTPYAFFMVASFFMVA